MKKNKNKRAKDVVKKKGLLFNELKTLYEKMDNSYVNIAKKMNDEVSNYLSGSSKLVELMRVKDKGQNIKFYVKKGSDENHVRELLMHLTGIEDNGEPMTVIMSITGNIDLKKISKLTKDLNVPGGENLKKLEDKKAN